MKKYITSQDILETNNYKHGFFGTMSGYYSNIVIQEFIWKPVFILILELTNYTKKEEIRLFLDSIYGRHLADILVEHFITLLEVDKKEYIHTADPIAEKETKDFMKKTISEHKEFILDVLNNINKYLGI